MLQECHKNGELSTILLPKEVITMPMSCIDDCEMFPRGGDPLGLSPGLFESNEGVNEHSVPRTEDES